MLIFIAGTLKINIKSVLNKITIKTSELDLSMF